MTTSTLHEPIKHERLHALDALRAIAMMLGVWLHAAIPYVEGVPPFFWAASDDDKSTPIGLSVVFIHSWRMEVFFLLSGFFTAMLVLRRGAMSTLLHRTKRILIPFLLAMLILQPICAAMWGYGYSTQWGWPMKDAVLNMIKSSWGIEIMGGDADFGRLWHFWFLYVLLWLIAGGLLIHAVGGKPIAKVSDALGLCVGWCFRSWAGAIVLAIPLFGALYLHSPNGPEPLISLKPHWETFLYYALPFFAGWVVYPKRVALGGLTRRWWVPFGIGLLIAAPIHLVSMGMLMEIDHAAGDQPNAGLIAAGNASRALMTTGLGLGLIGLFSRVLSSPGPKLSRVIRYGSDSSYWVYLAHLPIVVAFSVLSLRFEVGAELKMLFVMVASSVVLFVSYHFGVRYTPIGTLLNGKRQRETR